MNERQVAADVTVGAGENVVYVGYCRWKVIYGSSIRFTLAASMSR